MRIPKLSLIVEFDEELTEIFLVKDKGLIIYGVFWNPQDNQIPKLSLVTQLDQDLREKSGKQGVLFLMTSSVN